MQTLAVATPLAPARVRTGLALSALSVLFLLFDSVMKLLVVEPVVVSMQQLGYPVGQAFAIGLIELLCVVLYVVPRTAFLGTLLLTAYLGGAVATHVRIGSPLFSHVLFPTYVAALLWGGLYLREPRLRQLLQSAEPQSARR